MLLKIRDRIRLVLAIAVIVGLYVRREDTTAVIVSVANWFIADRVGGLPVAPGG